MEKPDTVIDCYHRNIINKHKLEETSSQKEIEEEVFVVDITNVILYCLEYEQNIENIMNTNVLKWADGFYWDIDCFYNLLQSCNEKNQIYILKLLKANFIFHPFNEEELIINYIKILTEYYFRIQENIKLKVMVLKVLCQYLIYDKKYLEHIYTDIILDIFNISVSSAGKIFCKAFAQVMEYLPNEIISNIGYQDLYNISINLLEHANYEDGSLILLTIFKKSNEANVEIIIDFVKLKEILISSLNEHKINATGILLLIETYIFLQKDTEFALEILCSTLDDVTAKYDEFSSAEKIAYLNFYYQCTAKFIPDMFCLFQNENIVLYILEICYKFIFDAIEVLPKKKPEVGFMVYKSSCFIKKN